MKVRLLVLLTSALLLLSCSGREDLDFDAAGLDDLSGRKVALMLGSIYDLSYSDSGMKVMRLNSSAEVFTALQSGIADYMLTSSTHTAGVDLASMGLKVNFEGFTSTDIACAFRKEDTLLCHSFNEFLSGLRQSGMLDSIIVRWTGDFDNVPDMPRIDTPVRVEGGKCLAVGSINTNYPFTFYHDGKLAGIEPEILDRYSQWSGIPVEYLDLDFAAAITGLVTGKVDIIAEAMSVTEERSRKVLFSDPYYQSVGQCLSRLPSESGDRTPLLEAIDKSFRNNLLVDNRWKALMEGLDLTIRVSLISVILGTLLSVPLCLMLRSRRRFVRVLARIYGRIMEGVPLLVILMVLFYVVFASSPVSPFWVAVTAFTLYFGNSAASLFDTALSQIQQGQWEAGMALGFSRMQTFFLVVFPQAAKTAVPVYKGSVSGLVKDTSIVGYVAISDLTKISDILRSSTFDAFFPLIVITVLYFIIIWAFGKAVDLVLATKSDSHK